MDTEKRLTPEQIGKMIIPEKTAQTIRLWMKTKGLPYTKNESGKNLTSKYALRKWCNFNGIEIKEGAIE